MCSSTTSCLGGRQRHVIADRRRARPACCIRSSTTARPRRSDRAASPGLHRACPANTTWKTRHPVHRLRRLVAALFPPTQFLAMLRVWRTLPDLVAVHAPAWFPGAQVVVTGACAPARACGGAARSRSSTTGAFAGPLGAYAVDLEGATVTVRRVCHRGDRWHPGRVWWR